MSATRIRHDVSLLSDMDVFLFNEGTHTKLYERLGAHPTEADGQAGTIFAVWAPNAEAVSVVGDFNGWDREADHLSVRGSSGICWTDLNRKPASHFSPWSIHARKIPTWSLLRMGPSGGMRLSVKASVR